MDWQRRNRDKMRNKNRKYYENNKTKEQQRSKIKHKKHPEQNAASCAVRYALKVGKMVKPDHCELCGSTDDLQAHHPNYSKKKEVEWLCASCHTKLHWEVSR
jgi:hypothetical protein